MIDKEEKKQGNKYLSEIYSYKRRPKSDYPNLLAKYLAKKFLKKVNGKLLDVGCGKGFMLYDFMQNVSTLHRRGGYHQEEFCSTYCRSF